MKSRKMTRIAGISLFTLLVMPVVLVAQENDQQLAQKPQHYTVTDLGTLEGGTFSQPFFMNKNGVVSGSSNLAANSQHAVLWVDRLIADLDTLDGPNSIAFDINTANLAVGEAETSTSDPNGEDFCGFGTHLICQPFLWDRGVMTALPTLGGSNGVVNQISDLGNAVGYAENTTPDPTCPAPQVLEFKPVVWANGKLNELPTVAGDAEGIALSSNENGQIVGSSGSCAAFNTATLFNLLPVHPLLWQKGKVTDLGNLGGNTGAAGGNLAWGINNHGQVIGVSDLAGDTTFHAFLWTAATGMKDLGTLSGDFASSASSINEQGDIVGLSLDANFNGRAFLWQKGVMTDLNTLISKKSSLHLISACSINSRGEIAGFAMTSKGEFHAYRAIPIHRELGIASDVGNQSNESEEQAQTAETSNDQVTLVASAEQR
jgi:probable HAF family extracellular repeat protein